MVLMLATYGETHDKLDYTTSRADLTEEIKKGKLEDGLGGVWEVKRCGGDRISPGDARSTGISF
jgi:hypothetical protein